MKNSLELRQNRADILREARALLDAAKAQGRNLNPNERVKYSGLLSQANTLKDQIAATERGHTAGVLGGGVIQPGEDDFFQQNREDILAFANSAAGRDAHPRYVETPADREHRSAFVTYLRVGLTQMPEQQRSILERYRAPVGPATQFRDMGEGSAGAFGAYPGSTVGFFVPIGFVNAIIDALKYFGPMLDPDRCDVMDTATGQPLPYPIDNDTSVMGERVAESQQVTAQDVALGQIMFGAWKYSSRMVKVSIELIQDSAFDLEKYLIRIFAIRLGRILVSDFTNGLGPASQQPYGVVKATLDNGPLVAAVGSATNTGNADGTNTLGTDDFIALEHAVDKLYRPGGAYMAHDSVWKKVKQTKDKYGRPLYLPALSAGVPDTINGYPMLTNNFMDVLQVSPGSPQVTRNTVLFGDLKRYIIRRVRDMSVLTLRERFADYGQVAFLAFARYDGQPAAAATGALFPFALLQNVY